MSFKTKLLQIYAKYDLNPTSLSKRLGYHKAEKLARLTRDEKNLPSYDIIRDLVIYFKQIDPHWWFTQDDQIVEEDKIVYGFCKECIKKDGRIEQLEKQCAAKDKEIHELLIKGSQSPGDAVSQADAEKKAS